MRKPVNVKVTDSGATLLIAGDTEEAVRLEILAREGAGSRLIGSPGRVGSRWFADGEQARGRRGAGALCVGRRRAAPLLDRAHRPTGDRARNDEEAAVCDAIANLMTGGAKVLAPPECSRGEWSAVLDAPR